jgi:hypothetical protein
MIALLHFIEPNNYLSESAELFVGKLLLGQDSCLAVAKQTWMDTTACLASCSTGLLQGSSQQGYYGGVSMPKDVHHIFHRDPTTLMNPQAAWLCEQVSFENGLRMHRFPMYIV